MATALAGAAFAVPRSGAIAVSSPSKNKFKLSYQPPASVRTAFCFPNKGRLGFAPFNPVNRRRATFAVYQKVAETESKQAEDESDAEEVEESDAEDSKDATEDQEPASVLPTLLQAYKEAIANNDGIKIADIEKELKAIEEEKSALSQQVATLVEEVSTGKERFLRLNADFDNFRKRAERDRLALASNIQGEVIESLLPMVDNFERAKTQIKTQTEGEEKIDSSYQGIYKQFVEIMKSLHVSVVETVGKPFDPMLHEAIMREDSTAFEEGIIIQEFRRGFILGDRLLRPAMVKVSAGPGPAKPPKGSAKPDDEVDNDTLQDVNANAADYSDAPQKEA